MTKRRRRAQRIRTPAIIGGQPNISRNLPVYEILDQANIEAVHDHSMQILEQVGIEFRDTVALASWAQAGADVKGSRVRIDRKLLMKTISHAPSEYIQHARNPDRSVKIGGNSMVFAPIYGSPYVRDFEGVRRYAEMADFENFVRLTYMSSALTHSGGTVCEPTDVPVQKRHLDMLFAHIRLSDKPFMGGVTSPERAKDCIDMCKILFGNDFIDKNTVMTSLINCNSPLVWDETMLSVIRVYAASNQACIISPFIMQGANTPITTVGAFSQLNAEALAGIAYAQLIRPGTPVIYGATLSTVAMQTGSPMYGTSETQLLTMLTGQMARHYGFPMRTGGMRTGSKMADSQAAYESTQTMLPAILAGGNFFLHSAGWLESGLSASFAKFIMDEDQLKVMQRMAGGLQLSAEEFGLDAVKEVGPGGHFFGCAHTLRHYQNAYYVPETSDLGTYEQWQEEGEKDALMRANAIAKTRLEQYEPPPLDQGIEEELRAFIQVRKAELPDGIL